MIRSHSRPIHFLLTNAKKARPDLAETLEPYRPELRIVFIAQHPSEILPNVLHPEIALAKVQELLKPQTGTAPSSLPLSNDKAHHPPRT
jgi:hypothetical protein